VRMYAQVLRSAEGACVAGRCNAPGRLSKFGSDRLKLPKTPFSGIGRRISGRVYVSLILERQ
jgi:hypothetical protein